jgi:nucleosome binding factor SPN SPT16 subunit
MNYYPDQLRSIAKLIEALNVLDREAEGSVTLVNRIAVVDSESDETLGYLVDEIGGAWSFLPVENGNGCDPEDDNADEDADEDADDVEDDAADDEADEEDEDEDGTEDDDDDDDPTGLTGSAL